MNDVPNDVQQSEDRKPSTAPYVWTAPDGRPVMLKAFNRIPTGVFRKARLEDDEMRQTFSLLEAATDEAGLAVIDDLPIGDLEKLFAAWTEASGVESGESSGSSS